MLDPGLVGSPVDVATLLVVLAHVYDTRDDHGLLAAGVVALARGRAGVDDDRLQADLDVDDRQVDALVREPCAADGGRRD